MARPSLLAGLAAGTAPAAPRLARQEPLQPGTPAADCRAIDPPRPTRPRSAVMRPLGERAGDRRPRARALSAAAISGGARRLNTLAEPSVRCVNVDGLVRTGARDHRLPRHRVERGVHGRSPGPPQPADRGADVRLAHSDPVRSGAGRHARRSRRSSPSAGCCPPDCMAGAKWRFAPPSCRTSACGSSARRGNGEVWTPSYRVGPNRPRAMLRYDAPAPGRLPGMVSGLALAERQTYAYEALGGDFHETRYRVGGALSDWVTSWLRWEAGMAFDRIGAALAVALEGSLNARALDDRLALIASAGCWVGAGAQEFFQLRRTRRHRSGRRRARTSPSSPAVAASPPSPRPSPLAVWPAAGQTEVRGAFLRAHPLRTNSVITGEVFGRTMQSLVGRIPASVPHPVRARSPWSASSTGPGLAPARQQRLAIPRRRRHRRPTECPRCRAIRSRSATGSATAASRVSAGLRGQLWGRR